MKTTHPKEIEEALNKIVGALSNWNFHHLLGEIELVKQAIKKNKPEPYGYRLH